MSLNKIPLLLSAALCHHIAQTSPNPPPPSEKQLQPTAAEVFFANFFKWGPWFDKLGVWTATLGECAVILAAHFPSSPPAKTILSALTFGGNPEHIRITRLFIVGWILATIGGYTRLACYRALGHMFTFELAIHDQHKLVTSGPYNIVRHPSYTGFTIVKIGIIACHLSSASWITQCGVWESTVGKTLAMAWVAWSTFVVGNMMLRTAQEDEVLKGEFKEQWVEWSKRVPYQLFPGIY